MVEKNCRYCDSGVTRVVLMPPDSPHYAKLVCADCGKYLKWVSRPQEPSGDIPGAILARLHPRRRPAPLDGTEAQCRYARSIRATVLRELDRRGLDHLVLLARCVVDATWWIANRGKWPKSLRWPRPDQMESAVADGKCPNCGDLTYGRDTCSDECWDEFSAYLILEQDKEVSRP